MALISEKEHQKRLIDYGVNIRTKYIVGNNILERNTNNTINDNIDKGIIFEKEYYKNDKLIHTEKVFDSRMEYTYIISNESKKNYTCPNCGLNSKIYDFVDGCPYCKTSYNIDYTNKELGSKYHYDRVLKNNTYKKITLIIDWIMSIFICLLYIKTTARTFNIYDISKIFIYGTILSLVLYYIFYLIDAYIILYPIKKYKDKQNKLQIEFWAETKIDKKRFFNNVNYELSNYYYNMDYVIDYDILDYIKFKKYEELENVYIKTLIEIRVIYLKNNKIISKISNQEFTFMRNSNEILDLKDTVNIIKCPNCGASIDIVKGKCDYCNYVIKNIQEWILKK